MTSPQSENLTPTPTYKKLTHCLACDGPDLHTYLDLGNQPLANSYVSKPKFLKRYPLKANFCKDCNHSQLSIAVDPKEMFADYKYVSGTTTTLNNHFYDFAIDAISRAKQRGVLVPRVLDIGCNDGTLLYKFRAVNPESPVYGVDPAENLIEVRKNDLPVMVDYWSSETAQRLGCSFDIVTACNVFAHNLDPLDFLAACKSVLSAKGLIIIEFPYGKNTIRENQFDQFYHEHVNYFNVSSFQALVQRAGLHIVDTVETPIHGGSVRFFLSLRQGELCSVSHLEQMNLAEQIEGLHRLETYQQFAHQIDENVRMLWYQLGLLKELHGYRLIGYGASAKSTVLLNRPAAYPHHPLEYIVDDNPLKQGLFCPNSNVPIYPTAKLLEETRPYAIVILSWNFKDEILKRIRALQSTQAHTNYAAGYVPHFAIEAI